MTSPLKNPKSPTKNTTRNLPKTILNDYQIACTHLIDAIYHGIVNSSYQRDGFGILMTDDYDTFLGYFRYNKLHGLGLIVYKDGGVIYGNFNNGQLEGITLSDNSHQLQVGSFYNNGMVGVGFEYNYDQSLWKMNRYHKGVAIQTLNQQRLSIEDQLPEMLSLQPVILRHLIQYKTKNLFLPDKSNQENKSIVENVNKFYCHELPSQNYYYGALIDGKYEGLGVHYDNITKTVVEAGMHREGKLDGYGVKIDKALAREQYGFYKAGNKVGLFLQIFGNNSKLIHYGQKGMLQEKREAKLEAIKKQQKIYNYRQKDFLSLRHQTNLTNFKEIFQSSTFKAWKQQQRAEQLQGDKQNKNKVQPLKPKVKSPKSSSMGIIFEKPSIQIMKEKITHLLGKKSNSQGKSDKKNNLKILEQNQDDKKTNGQTVGDQNDQIATEESPIWCNPNLSTRKMTYNFSSKTKPHDRYYH